MWSINVDNFSKFKDASLQYQEYNSRHSFLTYINFYKKSCLVLLDIVFNYNFLLLQIEDEGNHGNDDTRLFILSTLAGQHKPRVSCALCKETLHVFDRYPLVDGTFFLSPRQHTSSAVEVSCSLKNVINFSQACMIITCRKYA